MHRFNSAALLSSLLLAAAVASPTPYSNSTIKWGPCSFNGSLPIVCGNVSVPLDYTQPNTSLNLQLVKVPAINSPSLGSILFNFGGPGGEAQRGLAKGASVYMNATGGSHDLIAFDPRGTGTTIPFSCYDDPAERRVAEARIMRGNESDAALGQIWAHQQVAGEACAKALGNTTGTLVGTAYTARDFIRVAEALGGDGLLRYWGFSYGTVLGATIAAMFPDKIDRMILDGVANSHEYFHGYDIEMMEDTDKALRAFCDECVASPENCALARENITGAELETKIYDLFDHLKFNPIAVGGLVLDYSLTKSLVFQSLYKPVAWPSMAFQLDSLLTGNKTALLEAVASAETEADAAAADPEDSAEALLGIRCGDKTVRAESLDDMRPAYDAAVKESRIGGDGQANMFATCAQWPMEAKGRYDGSFTATTRHPLLFIGSPFDPVTPLASAHNMSAGFADSVVLEHQGYGHASIAHKSKCTLSLVRKYFETGELPAPDTKCEADDKAFELASASTAAAAPVRLRRRYFDDVVSV